MMWQPRKLFWLLLGIALFIPASLIIARPPITLEYIDVSNTSVQGNGESFLGDISHNGRYVAFHSRANNLSAADPNVFVDLYLRDRVAGTTTHIAPILLNATPVAIQPPEISDDNNSIVFETLASLLPADTNGTYDVYLYSIPTGTFQLISAGTGSASRVPSVSYSSCYVAYEINPNGVFIYNRAGNITTLVAPGGGNPRISADGNYVVFIRRSDQSLQLYDRLNNTTTQLDGTSFAPHISADGTLIVYTYGGGGTRVVKTYNRLTNVYTVLSSTVAGDSGDVSVNADGSWVVFGSFANALVPGPDTQSMDIFAYEMATNSIERISYLTDGSQPNSRTDIPVISGNGLHVAFQTEATNYITPDTNAGLSDILVANYGLVNTPIGTPTDGSCTSAAPIYSSAPLPNSTITLTGTPGTTQNATLAISNIGTVGSLLNVTQVGALTNFTISALPTGLTPAASPANVTVSCVIPTVGPLIETLVVQTNETGTPLYSYTLQCVPLAPLYVSVPAPNSTIILTGAPGTTQNATLAISNAGMTGSLLNVTQIGALTNFTISALPTGLTPAAGSANVTISCVVPATSNSETLTVQTNEIVPLQYAYTLLCISNVTPMVSINSVIVTENAIIARFTISLNMPLGFDVTVGLLSSDISAFGGADYNTVGLGTAVIIPAGTTSATYDVFVNEDLLVESTETFDLTITSVTTGVTIAGGSGIGTIIDNDSPVISTPVTPPVNPPSHGGGAANGGNASNIGVFDPAISKIGFLVPGQVGVTGEQLEWVITVTNLGSVAGQNVTIIDTLDSRLAIDRVEAPGAAVTINGQTVTVVYPTLNVGQSVQFSIFTTTVRGASVTNTACVTAANQNAEVCATGSAVSNLPSTGEIPWWRKVLMGMLALGFGIGLFSLRWLKHEYFRMR
jgi:uncharacterized repeat protein (TIGR01451 family)